MSQKKLKRSPEWKKTTYATILEAVDLALSKKKRFARQSWGIKVGAKGTYVYTGENLCPIGALLWGRTATNDSTKYTDAAIALGVQMWSIYEFVMGFDGEYDDQSGDKRMYNAGVKMRDYIFLKGQDL